MTDTTLTQRTTVKATFTVERTYAASPARVFNASQCANMPELKPAILLPENERHQRAQTILDGSGVPVRHTDGNSAHYQVLRDLITLPMFEQFRSGGDYFATALHELGHASGHPSRLDRDLSGGFGSETYAREELRAELASYMIGQDIGLPHDPSQHISYIGSWIKALENDPKEIFRATADAQKIMDWCLARERTLAVEREPTVAAAADSPPLRLLPDVVIARETPTKVETPDMAADRTYLAVPYKDRAAAKQAGAKWDAAEKSWYRPPGAPLEPLQKWLPTQENSVARTPRDCRDEFRDFIVARGADLTSPRFASHPIADGQIHRIPAIDGRKGNNDCSYKLHADGIPAGWFRNFKTNEMHKYVSESVAAELTPAQRRELTNEAEERRRLRDAEQRENYRSAGLAAEAKFEGLSPAPADHPYLVRKGVEPHDLRVTDDGHLVAALRQADGTITSLQTIRADGWKGLEPGCQAVGSYAVIGALPVSPARIYIAEGYATAATIHEATREPAIVAIHTGNLAPVAATLRNLYPGAQLVFAADDDRLTFAGHPTRSHENPGRDAAVKAAAEVGGSVALPVFPADSRGSDWNDLALELGRGLVRDQLAAAVQQALPTRAAPELAMIR